MVEVSRIERAVRRLGERFGLTVFTPSEWAAYQNTYSQLAKCFAGKEAVAKSTRRGLQLPVC